MTPIERTAYPRFTRAPSVKELREIYTPTPTDVAFVSTHARGPAQKLTLMILLKVYQRLHYFPDPQTIPRAVIDHLRALVKYSSDLVPDIAPATLYRYYAAIREHLEIKHESKRLRRVTVEAMHKAAQVMENPSDLINAAIETLLAGAIELPAFGTLDRMAGRVRRFVNGNIYQRVAASLTPGEQETLLHLLEQDGVSPFTLFDRIKEGGHSISGANV